MTLGRGVYRYGASFVDRVTGLRFEAHHPAARADRWRAYLDGTINEYQRYGLSSLIDRPSLERADGVSLFFVGLDAQKRIVAGVRCHGPLDDAEASLALVEMASSPEIGEHREIVEGASPHGVVEIKGAWREHGEHSNHQVAEALTRCCVHALEWFGAELALAAVADRMEVLLSAGGGRMMGHESARYPSDEYRSVLIAWRRPRYGPCVSPEQAPLVRDEQQQLRQLPDGGMATGWRPIVLDLTRRSDRAILANLRGDPGIEHLDAADGQLVELSQLLPAAPTEALAEAPRHVYFPWRRAVVRMLGPTAFPLVRLDRNRHRITSEQQRRLAGQRVGVVGLSAGHAIAVTLALGGTCGELRLADFDEVALTNLNRLPATVLDIGVNKAVVAARRVAELDPYLRVEVTPAGVRVGNVEEFVAGLDVVVEECDELDVKVLVREVARRHGVPVVMATSDRGLLDVERFDLEPDRPLFHGLVPDLTAASLRGLSTAEKVPYVLRIVDAELMSPEGAASLAEIGHTLSTWPQLATEVTQGAAGAAAAVRRLGLGLPVPSGRVRADLEAMVGRLAGPVPSPSTPPRAGAEGAPPPPAMPGAPPADPLLAVAHAASLAPSGGNAQPWRFEVSPSALAIELDRTRTSRMDVKWRGSYLALGAALFNARVAAAAAGRLGDVELFPDGPSSDRVARLHFDAGADESLAALHPWVLARCANRRRAPAQPLEMTAVADLRRAVEAEGAALHLVTDADRLADCARMLGEAERIRFLTPELHADMMRELRWPGEDLRTGLDIRTLELSAGEVATLGVARRPEVMALLAGWDAGNALRNNAEGALRQASALAIVTVPAPTPTWYLHAGAAVERCWLVAQQAGLGVQPVSPVFVFAVQDADYEHLGGARFAGELRALSERFRAAIGLVPGEALGLVLRLSHAPPPTARSARLPLDEVARMSAAAPAFTPMPAATATGRPAAVPAATPGATNG
ncbi:MAG: Rv1355c family protein [Acidimicrobiales bacterium]